MHELNLCNSHSRLVQKHEEICKQSVRLDNSITKISNDGQEIKKMVESVSQTNVYLQHKCAHFVAKLHSTDMEHNALKNALHKNCVVLTRYADKGKELQSKNKSLSCQITQTSESLERDKTAMEQLREDLRSARTENTELKSERRRHERSLENYKELLRGYSRVACRASEMRGINRELSSFVIFMERQKDILTKKATGVYEDINLLQTLYRKLKRFTGKQSKISRYFLCMGGVGAVDCGVAPPSDTMKYHFFLCFYFTAVLRLKIVATFNAQFSNSK